MNLLQRKGLKSISKRFLIFSIIIFFFFFILLARLFFLQLVQGANYRQISEENRTQIVFKPAPRGNIFDRNGKLLVTSHPNFVLTFTPILSSKSQSLAEVSSKLSEILKWDSSYVLERIDKGGTYPFQSIRIKNDLSRDEAFSILERNLDFPGFDVQVESKRDYLYGDLAAHIIGYLGKISKNEMQNLEIEEYKADDLIGKSGIERVYNGYIKGKNGGTCIEVSANGQKLRILNYVEPLPGNDIILTIDSDLQRIAEKVFAVYTGSIIIMDSETGDILTLISNPSFNPNVFLDYLGEKQINYLLKSNQKPLFNRAIQAQYAPGSIFKIIAIISALEEGIVSPRDMFFCGGSYTVEGYNRVFKCWKKEGHKNVDMNKAIAESCDVYFYQVGLRLRVGTLPKYAKAFGLGKLTGIDLPGEREGIIPDRAWKKKTLHEEWWEGDTINMSIGQGYLWVTPLQMANLVNAVANEGKLFYPHIVKRIISSEGEIIKEFEPKLIKEIPLKSDTWRILKKGMVDTITKGTGQAAYCDRLPVAGKTGTAQNPQGNDHAWFVGFYPVDKPKLTFVIFVEHGGHGGVVAAPIAKEILTKYYGIKAESRNINTMDVID